MERRTFLGVIAGGLLAAPLAVEAQPAGKMARVGLLSDESPSLSSELLSSETFSRALHDLGWGEGQQVTFERRYSAGKNEILPDLAAELVHLKVDVLVAIGTPAARAARYATETIPIVFARVGDPVGSWLVQSFARPGGNVTGVSIVTVDLGPKRLELLRAAIPGVAQVGVLWDPSFPPAAPELKEIESAARSLRVELRSVGVQRPEEFEGALLAMTSHHAAALIVVSGRIFTQHRQRLAELTTKARLPMMSYRREVAEAGGLMSYGPNYPDMDRRAATYVDKILRGAKPNDLPVEQPTKVEFVINLKTAKALGLTIPPSLLQRADQVIE
jgi:putative ABC transport system substrate-binding protein